MPHTGFIVLSQSNLCMYWLFIWFSIISVSKDNFHCLIFIRLLFKFDFFKRKNFYKKGGRLFFFNILISMLDFLFY